MAGATTRRAEGSLLEGLETSTGHPRLHVRCERRPGMPVREQPSDRLRAMVLGACRRPRGNASRVSEYLLRLAVDSHLKRKNDRGLSRPVLEGRTLGHPKLERETGGVAQVAGQ